MDIFRDPWVLVSAIVLLGWLIITRIELWRRNKL